MPTVTLDATLTEVTVYSDCAHVVRTATTPLDPGTHRLALLGLPASLHLPSLRVEPSHGRVVAVEQQIVEIPREKRHDPARIQRSIEARVRTLALLKGRLAGLEAELALVDRLEPQGPQPPASTAPIAIAPLRPEVFAAGLELVLARRNEIVAELRAIERQRADEQAKLQVLHAAQDADGRPAARHSALIVQLELIGEPAVVAIRARYEASWATWRPFHQLTLDGEAGTVRCTTSADVWQETGEAWTDVALALSTAEAERGLALPAVQPWIIASAAAFVDDAAELYRARAARHIPAGRPPADDADAMSRYAAQFAEEGSFAALTCAGVVRLRTSDEGEAMATGSSAITPAFSGANVLSGRAPPRRAPPASARAIAGPEPRDGAGGYDHLHHVAGASTIESGPHRQRVTLGTTARPLRMLHRLRPAISPNAFANATVTIDGDAPFSSGRAAIWADGTYFGETTLAGTPPGGELRLELGADTRVRGLRRARTTQRTTGILHREDVQQVEVTIDLVNNRPDGVSLEVEDQIPLADDPRVTVKLQQSEPTAELDAITGRLRFALRLGGGATRSLRFRYTVTTENALAVRARLAEAR